MCIQQSFNIHKVKTDKTERRNGYNDRDFNTLFPVVDRIGRQETNKNTEELNKTISQWI